MNTSTATQTITNTKLAVATLLMLVAGGAALATVPFNRNRSTATNKWGNCVDEDNQFSRRGYNPMNFEQLLTKSKTKFAGGEYVDTCVTYQDTGKTYLQEGTCSAKQEFQYLSKNCAELNIGKQGTNFQCVEGACVDVVDALPDLVIDDVYFDPSAHKMHVTLKNKGLVASEAKDYAAQITWKNNKYQDIITSLSFDKLKILQSNETMIVNFDYPTAGSSYMSPSYATIKVDPYNLINESDESNNIQENVVVLAERPNLIVQSITFNINTAQAHIVIKNIGKGVSPLVYEKDIGLYIVWKDKDHNTLASKKMGLPSLSADTISLYEFDDGYPSQNVFPQYLSVEIDPMNIVDEENETDNSLSKKVVPLNVVAQSCEQLMPRYPAITETQAMSSSSVDIQASLSYYMDLCQGSGGACFNKYDATFVGCGISEEDCFAGGNDYVNTVCPL